MGAHCKIARLASAVDWVVTEQPGRELYLSQTLQLITHKHLIATRDGVADDKNVWQRRRFGKMGARLTHLTSRLPGRLRRDTSDIIGKNRLTCGHVQILRPARMHDDCEGVCVQGDEGLRQASLVGA